MSDTFKKALAIVFDSEGGFVDDPDDKGGRTNLGVTQGTLDAFRRNYAAHADGFPVDVKGLTHAQAEEIYYHMFWEAAGCERMPAMVAVAVFDYAVNSGPMKAFKRLQEALGVEPDGVWGPKTEAALARMDSGLAVDNLMRIRFEKWADDSTAWKYRKGWFQRGARLCRQIGQMFEQGHSREV